MRRFCGDFADIFDDFAHSTIIKRLYNDSAAVFIDFATILHNIQRLYNDSAEKPGKTAFFNESAPSMCCQNLLILEGRVTSEMGSGKKGFVQEMV